MTYRLAINTQHTSTIALEKNGLLLEVISEERITARKIDYAFPLKSLLAVPIILIVKCINTLLLKF